ncbi:MAG: translocation/assembly module TamB [Treponema sp.]|nr:translocation/assembly module TamB [Treponema sp.]
MAEPVKEGDRKKISNPLIGISIRILIFIGLIGGILLALGPVQANLQQRIEFARDNIIREAELFLGAKIQYGSISPSIFGVFDIRDLTIKRDDDSILLSVSRARLYYSIFAIFRANNLEMFRSMRFDQPVLSLDTAKDANLLQRFTGFRPNGEAESLHFRDLLPERFTFRIWNGEAEIRDTSGTVLFSDIGIDATVRQAEINFDGRFNGAVFLPAFNAVMSGRITGDYSGETDLGNAIVAISSITGDNFILQPMNISFFLSESLIEARKTHDSTPTAIFVLYDRQNSRLTGNFEGENFSPRDMVTLTGAFSEYNTALAVHISGNAGFIRDNSNGFQYNIDFSSSGPEDSAFQQIYLDLNMHGNGAFLIVDNFDFRSPFGNLEFQGGIDFNPNTPYGSLTLTDFRLQGDRGISGEFMLHTEGDEILLSGENLRTGDLSLSYLELSLIPYERGFNFNFSALNYNGALTHTGEGEAKSSLLLEGQLEVDPNFSRTRLAGATLLLDSFPVGDILKFAEPLIDISIPLPALAMLDDLVVNTRANFSTNNGDIFYDVPYFEAGHGGILGVHATAGFSGTNSNINLDHARFTFGEEVLEISGALDLSDFDEIIFSLDTRFNDLAYSFEGYIRDGQEITIWGSHGFQIILSAHESAGYSGFIRGDEIPVQDRERPALASFYIPIHLESPSSWRASIDRFEITGITTPVTSSGSVYLRGNANERGLIIPEIYFDDGRGPLQGGIAVSWDQSYRNFIFNAEVLGDRLESYNLSGSYRNNILDLDFSGSSMQLSRIINHNAMASGDINLRWESPESFELDVDLSSFVFHRQGGTIRASGNVSMNNDTLFAEKLAINRQGLELYIPIINIDRLSSSLETEALIWGAFSGKPVDILMRGEVSFNESDNWITLLTDLSYLNGSLFIDSARFDNLESTEPFDFHFTGSRETHGFALNLNGGPRNMVRFRFAPEENGGSFFAALSAPSPVRGTFAGSIISNMIDAQTSDLYVDMGSLWRFIPPEVDFIAFPAGIATGSIRMTGPISDPEFYGFVQGRSLQMLIPDFIGGIIRPVPIHVVLDGHDMTFGPIDAAVGQGMGRASGWFRFDQWVPNIFNIDIQVPHEHPIPYDINISGIIARGLASGRLSLSMEDLIFSVSGNLMAHDTVMSMNANELTGLLDYGSASLSDNLVHVATDITIQTGRRAEFIWPLEFPIIQANADMGTTINIRSDDIAGRYSLNGDVRLRSGEIFYLERNFYIREGTIFFRESELQFNPRISARAEIREQANSGPVTISMIIDNAPLMSFTPRFTSAPPLSQVEIYALLGQQPLEGTADGQLNFAASAAIDSLAQVIVVQRLQRQLRDFLGLDMLSVRTQILQNAIMQFTGQYGEGFDRSLVDNTTIFLGRYFGAEIFGEAMLSFRHDELMGTGGIRLESEFGLEMRNPFFDIRLSMIPLNAERLFIDDVSLSLIWRRSF